VRVSSPLSAITTARWIALRSSRTLPGQSWEIRRSSAAGERTGRDRTSRSPSPQGSAGDRGHVSRRPARVDRHRDRADPEKEILAERLAGDLLPEVPVRGGEDADVRQQQVVPPDPFHFLLFQRA